MARRSSKDFVARGHQEWIGLLQPVGLVVSPPALEKAGLVASKVNKSVKQLQDRLRDYLEAGGDREGRPRVLSLPELLQSLLEWEEEDLVPFDGDSAEHRDELTYSLEDFGETLRPTWAIPGGKGEAKWQALVKEIPHGRDFDDAKAYDERSWQASAQARFERLLWETQIPIGLLFNGTDIRLCYVPRGEAAGHLTFPLDAMCEVPNRSIAGAFEMLLSAERLFTAPKAQRLPALLEESRKYQSVVSTRLAEQVLAALHELVDGFQAANEHSDGRLLGEVLREDPQHVYGGLLSVILRLVFTLFAEDRNLMPDDPLYQEGYSVSRLFERLREDAALYPDTMDQRFGAWGQLLGLFRLIFDGASYRDPTTGELVTLPRRQGKLFNPDTYPFLEGRAWQVLRSDGERYTPPRVSDGVVYWVLRNLMLLDGQRLSYRTLDVEQIGSVYEALMGFVLETAAGPSVAVKPDNVVINLEELLGQKPAQRAKWLKDTAGLKLTAKASKPIKAAKTVDELVEALGNSVSTRSRGLIPATAMYLQPTEERRRSGSHYTPRALTEPIVRTAFRPIFERFGDKPTPTEILELKICDPAMGSGAFLVEVVRQLSDALVRAWANHPEDPTVPQELPPDETQELRAARLVAQRCVYGVDKNQFAVELAKLSLWLSTFAKDHPFTFVDHSLKHGDSLVGLTREQIARFSWKDGANVTFVSQFIEDYLKEAEIDRRTIQRLGDTDDNHQKQQLHRSVEDALETVRKIGDLVIAAFFLEAKDKVREEARKRFEDLSRMWLAEDADRSRIDELVASLQVGDHGVTPFHWEVEFPEVFRRKRPGFDVFAGNPPFAGKNTMANAVAPSYLDWLKNANADSHGNADLVAHFFRRTFALCRAQGTLGLLATNTIAQGDTRTTGLLWLCQNGAVIFSARKRYAWPGLAAVVVSVVHIHKGEYSGPKHLDSQACDEISPFLLRLGGAEEPESLLANAGLAFKGCVVLGAGFVFDGSADGAGSPERAQQLIAENPQNADRILPYLNGSELNSLPDHRSKRLIICFEDMSLEEAGRWPELLRIVEDKVRPYRMQQKDNADGRRRKKFWWQFGRYTPALYKAIGQRTRVLACSQTSKYRTFTFIPANQVFDQKLIAVALDQESAFSCLSSRPHEVWALFAGSTMKDDPVYTPSDCFETVPFPEGWESSEPLGQTGKRYYEYRARLMIEKDEGLTQTYNRFHDPNELSPEILKLRELHKEMDRAVLDAYGWTDIQPTCEFLLDYEEEDEDGKSKKKKPWRYRWPDEVRDEVLARLLELNKQRAEEEKRLAKEAGLSEKSGKKKATNKTRKAKKSDSKTGDLFG